MLGNDMNISLPSSIFWPSTLESSAPSPRLDGIPSIRWDGRGCCCSCPLGVSISETSESPHTEELPFSISHNDTDPILLRGQLERFTAALQRCALGGSEQRRADCCKMLWRRYGTKRGCGVVLFSMPTKGKETETLNGGGLLQILVGALWY